MQVSIPNETIREIADHLDLGMICFYHILSGELEYYPDESRGNAGFDKESWQESIDRVRENNHDYVPFEGMGSKDSFRIIETFVRGIAEEKTRLRFETAIAFKNPFQKFQQLLPDHPELLKQWLDYRSQWYIEWVEDKLDEYNSTPFKQLD